MKRTGIALGLFLALAASQVLAAGTLADVSVYDRASGRILPVYEQDGRWYVAGRTGNEYELRIRNNTAGDLLAVVSVDGVNVVTGETASTSQGGYVVGAWQSMSIAGWRKSMDRVAAFYFTEHSDAYATRTGRPNDVGVIGVAVFKRKIEPAAELELPSPRDDFARRKDRYGGESSSQPSQPSTGAAEGTGNAMDRAPRAAASAEPAPAPRAMEKSIGTGHGRSQTSHVRYVSFERESDTPNEVIALNYDTRSNLLARGIIPPQPREPNPFPARFVPDPPRRW
jgi:hypothetical protein